MKISANLRAAAGRAIIIPYDYPVPPVEDVYPEVEALFSASPFEDFLRDMASHIPDFEAFGGSDLDPKWGRGMFPPLDGAAAYAAVKHFRPQRIIEIGSGDSTHYLAKAADGAATKITCIDPAPRRSIEQLPVEFERRLLQVSDAALCGDLEPNDIFFIDSSHIMVPGIDVDIEFNRCFPRLKSGVIVHIHDIFLPFDYPPHWRARYYSEQNALVGWLFGSFDVLYPGHYVMRRHSDLIDELFAGFEPCRSRQAGSLWLRKR